MSRLSFRAIAFYLSTFTFAFSFLLLLFMFYVLLFMWADYLLEPSLFTPTSHSLMCLSGASVFCWRSVLFFSYLFWSPSLSKQMKSSPSCIAIVKNPHQNHRQHTIRFIKFFVFVPFVFCSCVPELKLVSISFLDCFLFAFLTHLHPTHAKVISDVKVFKTFFSRHGLNLY